MGNRIGGFSDSAMLGALLDALESANLGCAVVIAYPDRLETAYSNRALTRMNGIPFEQMKISHPFAALPPDELAKLSKLRWAVRRGEAEAPASVTSRFTHPDGTQVPVEIGLGYSLVGEQRATFAFVRDLTETVKMEAKLRESDHRFRALAEASPDAITIDVRGKCVYANPKALELFGLDDDSKLEAFRPRELVSPDRPREVDEFAASIARGESVAPFINVRKLPSGETRTLEVSVTSSMIDGERASLVYMRDITERVHFQAERLRQDRLASLGVLAAGVAHEINNPLAALSFLVRRLRLEAVEKSPGHDPELLDQVDDAVARMTTIIGDLLLLARPSEKPLAHVDLGRVLASATALLRAGVTHCPPITETIESLPAISGVPSRLGQLFLNLLRNAIDAVEGRPNGHIHVGGRVDGSEVSITVKDNGAGIPKDVLPRLMTPFYTTKEHGTGLGLWIGQAIVSAHHGRIEIRSEPGDGTVVKVILPV